MKNFSYIGLILLLLFIACNDKNEEIPENISLPDCIASIANELPQITIQAQEIDHSTHYWINTGANALDGDEYILSSSCDTVCYYGGWINPECIEDYQADEWTIVWP